MRAISSLIAVSALAVSSAFAAGQAAAPAPAANAGTQAKNEKFEACRKEADAKHLTGKARDEYIVKCQTGKDKAAK
ncbi:MAG: hypothetical protein R3E77_15495 [Steroidobacteraceae bacterium]